MDRTDIFDRLGKRLPVVGDDEDEPEPTATHGETPPPDVEPEPAEFDPGGRASQTDEGDVDGAEPEEEDSDLAADKEPEEGERRRQLRTVLLGVSVFGGVLAVVAALLRRLLGRGEDDEEGEPEPDAESPEPDSESADTSPPLEEGTAAALGLAFLLVAEAIRDWLADSTH